MGYREYAVRSAELYEITGEVWNRVDEAVEIIAQHKDAVVLDVFAEELKFGPGRVDSVSEEAYDPAQEYEGFKVTFVI